MTEGVEVVDCSDKLVMPGLIDSHNHLAAGRPVTVRLYPDYE